MRREHQPLSPGRLFRHIIAVNTFISRYGSIIPLINKASRKLTTLKLQTCQLVELQATYTTKSKKSFKVWGCVLQEMQQLY